MGHNIINHQNFLSLNSGGLADLKIRIFAVCFSSWKMSALFFLLENVWDLLLSQSCFTHSSETEMLGQPGTQWHKVISCVTLASLTVRGAWFSERAGWGGGGSPAPKICFAGRKGSSARAISSTEDMEVMISVWMDVSIPLFLHAKTPFSSLSSRMLMFNRAQSCTKRAHIIVLRINAPVEVTYLEFRVLRKTFFFLFTVYQELSHSMPLMFPFFCLCKWVTGQQASLDLAELGTEPHLSKLLQHKISVCAWTRGLLWG